MKNKEKVITFLCCAKKETYAGYGQEQTASRPNSHDLQYEEGGLKYIDTYLGSEKFSGEEAIWEKDEPIWAMNYTGRLVGEGFLGGFLKEVLARVDKDYPYRGPLFYEKEDYEYHCSVNGEFEWFQGYEEIFYKGNKIYECYFHGGLVK